jgi:transcriptional regulator with XRE-family HTH domain
MLFMSNEFGEKIKRLRVAHHMSLGDLAEKVQTSRSFLSQLEQGKSLPSLGTLKAIADAFDVTVGSLVDEPKEVKSPLVKVADRPKVNQLQTGILIESLTYREMHKTLQPLILTLQPGANSGYEGYIHKGQEFGFVVKGKMTVELDDNTYEMNAGDSIYFDSSRPHRFVNNSDGETVAVWVITPPTF